MRKSSRRHSKRHSKKHQKGGYSSATTYGEYMAGSLPSQMSRTFDIGGAYGKIPGNALIGTGGQGSTYGSGMPNTSLIQKAGGKRRRKKGGNLGAVISQAIVPFSLLGLQHTYKKRHHHHSGHKSRRHHRRY
jgi:hypothetical protein